MSASRKSVVTRRDLLRRALAAAVLAPAALACAGAPPAPTAAPPATAAPTKPAQAPPTTAPAAAATIAPAARPDWIAAGKRFPGRTLNGVVSTEDSGKLLGRVAEELGQQAGFSVKVEQVPVAGYPAKIQAELVSRSGNLDFIAMLIGDVAQYVKAGLLQPLDQYLDDPTYPDYDLKDFPDNVLNVWSRHQDKTYALPALGGAQIMYYRKDLFAEAGLKPPTTWPELYDAAKKLKKGDVWGAALGLKGTNPSFRIPNAFAPGLPWLDKEMRLSVLRDPKTIENIDVWARLFKDELIPKDDLANDTNATYALYQTGNAAILPMAWPVFVPNIVDPAKSKVGPQSGYAPIPGASPNAGGWSLVVPSDSKNKEAAYLAISWITNKPNSARQITTAGITDAGMRRSIYTDAFKAEVARSPAGPAVVEALAAQSPSWANARPVPTIAEWPKLQDVINPLIQKIVAGQVPAKDGLNQAADGCEKILADAGYYKK